MAITIAYFAVPAVAPVVAIIGHPYAIVPAFIVTIDVAAMIAPIAAFHDPAAGDPDANRHFIPVAGRATVAAVVNHHTIRPIVVVMAVVDGGGDDEAAEKSSDDRQPFVASGSGLGSEGEGRSSD